MRVSDLSRVSQLDLVVERVRAIGSKAFLFCILYLCSHSYLGSKDNSCFLLPLQRASALDFTFSANGIIMSQGSNLIIFNISLFFTLHIQLVSKSCQICPQVYIRSKDFSLPAHLLFQPDPFSPRVPLPSPCHHPYLSFPSTSNCILHIEPRMIFWDVKIRRFCPLRVLQCEFCRVCNLPQSNWGKGSL